MTTFGSSLNRNTPTKKDKAAASENAKSSSSASPLRSFRKPGNTNSSSKPKAKVSLEDQNSQDFVPITNSGKKKKRVLTEHQKDKMTSRPQNIPALYSEVSREDSMAMMAIPAEFDSQSSSSFQVRAQTRFVVALESNLWLSSQCSIIQTDRKSCVIPLPTTANAFHATFRERK